MPPPVTGTPLVSDGNNALIFSPYTIPYVRNLWWYGAFAQQDFNAAAGPTPVVFSTTLASTANKTNGPTVSNVIQLSNTEFTGGFTSQARWRVDVNIYFDPASSGIGNSTEKKKKKKNGIIQRLDGALSNGGTNTITGTFFISMGDLETVRFVVQRISGTGQLNTYPPNGAGSLYSSRISWQLIDFVR